MGIWLFSGSKGLFLSNFQMDNLEMASVLRGDGELVVIFTISTFNSP